MKFDWKGAVRPLPAKEQIWPPDQWGGTKKAPDWGQLRGAAPDATDNVKPSLASAGGEE